MVSAHFEVGKGYLDQFGLKIRAGSDFPDSATEDASSDVIINETFARSRGWTDADALNRSFRIDSLSYSVIGVVADFAYDDFYDPMDPAFLHLTGEKGFYFLTMKLRPGTGAETAAAVEARWKSLFPDKAYNGFFQDTVFDSLYRENTNIKRLFSFIAALALVIACLGLFGLAAQNIMRRMREISIRKVLGGSVAHISQVVNRGFLLLVALAAIIGTPLGYVAMKTLLESVYADPIPLGPYPFFLSFMFVALTALATVASQAYRVAYNNPADVLRNE